MSDEKAQAKGWQKNNGKLESPATSQLSDSAVRPLSLFLPAASQTVSLFILDKFDTRDVERYEFIRAETREHCERYAIVSGSRQSTGFEEKASESRK